MNVTNYTEPNRFRSKLYASWLKHKRSRKITISRLSFVVTQIFGMKNQRFPGYIRYAVLAIICPLFAFGGTLVYQAIANSNFWQSITPDESAAGAMMAFAEFVQLIFFTLIGCFVGLIFAVISLWLWLKQRALRKLVNIE